MVTNRSGQAKWGLYWCAVGYGVWCLARLPNLLNKTGDGDELAKWETKQEKAAGEIYLGVESDQRVHFRGQEDDPKAMWDSLKKAHLHQKPGARFNAYDELFSIHKADDETLMDVATRVEKAMSNIKNLRPTDFTLDKLDDELLCMAMIHALPESFANLTSNLLLVDKLDKSVILQAFKSE